MSITSSMRPLWPKLSARAAALKTFGSSTVRRISRLRPQMESVLYVIGTIIMILGGLLVVPTLSRVTQVSDPIMLLGAPIVMNGIWLLVVGIVICALARIIQLLNRAPQNAGSIDIDEGESKVVIRCPGCGQRLRVDRGRRGIISCPNCKSNFQAQTVLP
jgi:hypothetical protein